MMRAIAGIWGAMSGAPEHCESMLAQMTASTATLLIADHETAPAFGVLGSSPYQQIQSAASSASQQHMAGNDCLLVADGRLDNRAELSQRLGLSLRATDEELLKGAWQRWGSAMADHLLGGFALACWDPRSHTLFLARDHSGERPLHFARPSGSSSVFAFASMPLALCELPWIGRSIDVARMSLMLGLVEPGNPQTCFRGVERLPPGHWLKLTPQGLEIRRYWHPADAPPIRYKRDDEYVEDLRERLDRAVSVRLAGAHGIGSEISGGLDSSSVTVTAARLLAQQGRRLTSFTAVPIAGYDGRVLAGGFGNEGPIAAEATALYPNIDHILVTSEGRDLVQTCIRGAELTGEPVVNPTNQVWLNAILDNTRSRGLDVLLHGVSGNVTISFSGIVGLSDLFRRGRWFSLLRQVRDLRAGGHISWRGGAAWATGPVIPLGLRRLFHPELRGFSFDFSPVHPARATEYDLPRRVFEGFYGADSSTEVSRRRMAEFFDPGVANAGAAAGWQVERRDPTQDKRIYEFCFGIPIEQYLVGGQARSLIRRAMKGRLPEATLRRTDRGQQAADWYLVMGAQRRKLSAELKRVEQAPLVRHLIDIPRLHALLEHWPETGHDQPKVYEEWHSALSRGIAAASFLALHDPDMPQDTEPAPASAAETKRPGI